MAYKIQAIYSSPIVYSSSCMMGEKKSPIIVSSVSHFQGEMSPFHVGHGEIREEEEAKKYDTFLSITKSDIILQNIWVGLWRFLHQFYISKTGQNLSSVVSKVTLKCSVQCKWIVKFFARWIVKFSLCCSPF